MSLIRFTMALLVAAMLVVGIGCNAGVRTNEPVEGPVDNSSLSTVVPPDTNDIPEDEPEPEPDPELVA
ncbi:MAG: hypothetical protein HN929_06655 [Chloroflexi bacterium]|nr:hypothetical protein [Chloroflexota bacterium]MBT7081126.1 hypothetical protein [Chloroflexota bacterium]MBT7289263.1 hypothetical protein [Chloroflexota bacterium]